MKSRPPSPRFAAWLLLFALGCAPVLNAAPEIVVAIRYLQAEGESHSHLFLYREDGKLLRQLTNAPAGQDLDPSFAPDGETIVFTREAKGGAHEFWTVGPRGDGLQRLDAAPAWYTASHTSPFFTNIGDEPADASKPPVYRAPDQSAEIELRNPPADEFFDIDGPGHGSHFILRDLRRGDSVELGQVPGFEGLYDLLHLMGNPDTRYLLDGPLRVAFFGLHLDSTEGDTVYALDLGARRLTRLSPNWAAPVPLPGEAAFLTKTENRYVPIPGSKKTANCCFLERWSADLKKVRFARNGSAATFYGASMFRQGMTPTVIILRQDAD